MSFIFLSDSSPNRLVFRCDCCGRTASSQLPLEAQQLCGLVRTCRRDRSGLTCGADRGNRSDRFGIRRVKVKGIEPGLERPRLESMTCWSLLILKGLRFSRRLEGPMEIGITTLR